MCLPNNFYWRKTNVWGYHINATKIASCAIGVLSYQYESKSNSSNNFSVDPRGKELKFPEFRRKNKRANTTSHFAFTLCIITRFKLFFLGGGSCGIGRLFTPGYNAQHNFRNSKFGIWKTDANFLYSLKPKLFAYPNDLSSVVHV
jgi:hypothetical protein